MNKACKMTMRLIRLTDVDNLVSRLPKAAADNAKRQLREKILFPKVDVYDNKVNKGRETESAEQKAQVDEWHKKLLDLDVQAFKDVPPCVAKYRQDLR